MCATPRRPPREMPAASVPAACHLHRNNSVGHAPNASARAMTVPCSGRHPRGRGSRQEASHLRDRLSHGKRVCMRSRIGPSQPQITILRQQRGKRAARATHSPQLGAHTEPALRTTSRAASSRDDLGVGVGSPPKDPPYNAAQKTSAPAWAQLVHMDTCVPTKRVQHDIVI